MDSTTEELVSQLDDGDMAALRRRYQAGGLAFLRPRLGEPLYRELGARLDGGDRVGVWALLIDRGVVPAPAGWAESADRERGIPAWLGLLPLLVLLAVAALLLGRCGDDDTTLNVLGSDVPTSAAPSTSAASPSTVRAAGTATTADRTTTAATPSKAPGTTAATTTTTAPVADGSLAGTLAADPQFSVLNGLLVKAGLTGALRASGPFTVFAPTNAAIATLPAPTLAALGANPEALTAVLTYHVLAGALPSSALVSGTPATLNGELLTIAVSDAAVSVDSAQVTQPDVVGSNGVAHGIDAVLLPSKLQLGAAQPQVFPVYFDINDADPNAASLATLDQARSALTASKAGTTVILTGFADLSGDPVSNLALSASRAESVRAAVAAANAGLAYVTNAKGDTEPGATIAQSRRVDLVIS